MSNVTAIDLSFSRDEELSPEKLSAFERALEHSQSLYKEGLAMHSEILGNVPNKHIKVSLATANSAANMVLDSTLCTAHGSQPRSSPSARNSRRRQGRYGNGSR